MTTSAPSTATPTPPWRVALHGFLSPGSAQRTLGPVWLGDLTRAMAAAWWVTFAGGGAALIWSPDSAFAAVLDPRWGATLTTIFVFFTAFWAGLAVATGIQARRAARHTGNVTPSTTVALAAVTALAILASSGVAAATAGGIHATRAAASDVFTSAPPPDRWNGRWNIALLGGDAGVDRDGRRIDSISVLSVDPASGDAAIISVPRGLQQIPLSAGSPLLEIWTSGVYDCGHACQIGFLYPYAETTWAARFEATVPADSSPGIEALRDGLEGLLELPIHAYIMIDYDDFATIVDTLGGVTVDVRERLPIGGDQNQLGVAGWIEPGVRALDGRDAMWYARSRFTTDEADRIRRQGELLAAVLRKAQSPLGLPRLAALADTGAVQTDVTTGMLPDLLGAALSADPASLRVLSLATATTDVANPDIAQIRSAVRGLLTVD